MVSFIGISLTNMQKNRNRKMEKMKSGGCSSELKLCKASDCQEKIPFKNMILELLFIIREELERGVACDKVPTSSGSTLT